MNGLKLLLEMPDSVAFVVQIDNHIIAMATVKQYTNELAMDFHTAVRYIERVADRSGNIAEYVYYAVTGYRFPDNKKQV